MADKRISQLIERTDIANNDVLPIVASGATTTNKVTISTIQTWMQDNLDVGVTSVGLSMPSAFVVSNSPVTASGNITVTGAGTVAQYIRGDGSLADFPQSAGGGGASVSYYLNGSVSQGTIGGIAYLEMNKTPILAAGTDFTIAADGYIASFITDAGDPGLLEIPAGNWNFETYLSATSGGGSPTFYIELYKVNSGGTATLIASNSATPESISLGTNINPYFSALAVPTTTLALTDRLALRYYVTHAGRTITLHTENSHLCQIITTFTTGLTALNGLTAQVQNFATGTSGTDFNISSAGSTHTFNIPSASATARGLVTTGSQTIAGSKTFSDTLFTTPDAIINGINVGKGAGNITTNTRIGTAALGANTTGSSNTAIGFGSSQSNTTGTSNTAVGLYSLLYNTIGASNTAIGSGSMLSNTIGNQNTAIGDSSLYSNTSGSQNTAIGRGSLNTNSTGNDNSGIGFFALYSNTTGSANTSVGSRSLYTNTTGTGNTATGYFSLRFNTTGGSNTATGYVALSANTTGNANTATGAYALENNTTGGSNTAVGQEALENNTTGGNNTAIGFQALRSNTGNGANTAVGNLSLWNNTAGLNTALGHISLYSNTTGIYNVGLGIASLYNNTTGSYNIAIGDQSGQFISGGGNNIISNNSLFIGTQTRALGDNQTNQIVIGHNAIGNGSNTVTIGNDSITSNIFSGNLSTRRAVGTASEGIIELRPNTGSSNIIIASGAVPLHILSTSGSLGLGVGNTPQVTIASGGAVTLTGALSGTSAVFSSTLRATKLSLGTSTTTFPINVEDSTQTNSYFALFNTIGTAGATSGIRFGVANGTLTAGNSGEIISRGLSAADAAMDLKVLSNYSLITALSLGSSGAATFSSSVTATTLTATGSVVEIQGSANSFKTFYLNRYGVASGSQHRLRSENGYFEIASANSEPIVLTGGNVGIGTPTPGNLFSIEKSSNSGSGSTFPRMSIKNTLATQGDGSSTFNFADILISSGNESVNMFLATTYAAGSWAPAGIINVATNHDLQIKTNNLERMRITSGGAVLVNQTTLSAAGAGNKMQVATDMLTTGPLAGYFFENRSGGVTSSTNWYGWYAVSGTVFLFNGSSNVASINPSTGAYTALSDVNKKKDFEESQIGLNEVMALKPTLYRMSDDESEGEKELGFIAQEVKEVIPQAYVEGGEEESKFIGLNYNAIVAALVKSVQEQQEQIKALTEQVEALKSQING